MSGPPPTPTPTPTPTPSALTNLVTGAMAGQTVKFNSKSATDSTTYVGVISVPIVTPAFAPNFGMDTLSYNQAVQRADSTVGDISTLHYFIITLQTNQATQTNQLFANEWIAPASFSIIEPATVYNFNVYDLPSGGVEALTTLLEANGYKVVFTPSTGS